MRYKRGTIYCREPVSLTGSRADLVKETPKAKHRPKILMIFFVITGIGVEKLIQAANALRTSSGDYRICSGMYTSCSGAEKRYDGNVYASRLIKTDGEMPLQTVFSKIETNGC